MPHIVVLATGGTIASRASSHGGSVAADSGQALLRAVSETVEGLSTEAIDVARVNSFNLSLADQAQIVALVRQQLDRPGVDGVVVTHGTDTMEETSFLVDLCVSDPRPIVFTGAQRPADSPDTDGPANLRDALAVAASAQARGRGVLIAFAGDILAARGVRKVHTLAPQPFGSTTGGPVGRIVGSTIQFDLAPEPWTRLDPPSSHFGEIIVDSVLVYPGAGPRLLAAAVDRGARGVVVVGTGAGNSNSALVPQIAHMTAAGVVVALSTRVPFGPVVPLYGDGGAADAVEAGAIAMGALPHPQVRMLLTLLLDNYEPDQVRALLGSFDLRP